MDPRAIGAIYCYHVLSDWGYRANQPLERMTVVMYDVAQEIGGLIDRSVEWGTVLVIPDLNDTSPLRTVGAVRLNSSLNLLAAMAKIDPVHLHCTRQALLTEIQALVALECAWKRYGTYMFKGNAHIDLTEEDIDALF